MPPNSMIQAILTYQTDSGLPFQPLDEAIGRVVASAEEHMAIPMSVFLGLDRLGHSITKKLLCTVPADLEAIGSNASESCWHNTRSASNCLRVSGCACILPTGRAR